MDKNTLMKHIGVGRSTSQISEIEGKSQTMVMKWLKKFDLKTKHKKISGGFDPSIYRKYGKKYSSYLLLPWESIQKYYDGGLSCRQLNDKFKLNNAKLNWATKNGLLKRRTLKESIQLAKDLGKFENRHHSVSTKKKLSNLIKNRIELGQHKGFPHRKKFEMSYPERFFSLMLKNNNIEYEFDKHVGKYWIDFAIKNKMIALEIDGSQHKLIERKRSDDTKDKFLIENGWKVYRIPWKSINSESGKLYIKNEIDKFLEFCK